MPTTVLSPWLRRPLLVLTTCALLSWPASAQEPANKSNTAPAKVQVGVARLDQVWLYPQREAPATVVARNESKLAAETSGTLLRWSADVGEQVQRGQVLTQIDPRDAELGVQRAQAALDASSARLKLAQAQLQRSRELVAQGFFSQEALAQRETEVALIQSELSANKAQLATAQRLLGKTTLRAPFSGSVKERLAQTGEAVAPGTVLYVLIETGTQEVAATLSPGDVSGLRTASEVHFDARGQSHALRLLRVAATITFPARTQEARLAFTSLANAPPAGSSGALRWRDKQPHVTPDLMVRRGDDLGLFVQEGTGTDAKARFTPLPGAQEGRATPVPASLSVSALIIVRGQAVLQDAQAIDPQSVTRTTVGQ